ncbi:hypothetical protein Bbelb_173280 [Branchiostoma belcheri]|nr:hypothetical protein Bbelb_173280 [Branchiostoma belcheri]
MRTLQPCAHCNHAHTATMCTLVLQPSAHCNYVHTGTATMCTLNPCAHCNYAHRKPQQEHLIASAPVGNTSSHLHDATGAVFPACRPRHLCFRCYSQELMSELIYPRPLTRQAKTCRVGGAPVADCTDFSNNIERSLSHPGLADDRPDFREWPFLCTPEKCTSRP